MISVLDPISHGRRGADDVCVRKPVRRESKRISAMEGFIVEFARELDIFDSESSVPNWIFRVREDQISKISSELRKICSWLKSRDFDFKIKWPVEIGRKWKFADVYFPKLDLVLIVSNAMSLIGKPCWAMSERAEFFRPRYMVIEVETLRELERKKLFDTIIQEVS